ncbi:hypothetical protein RF11_13197 [Thelohanellus kitauei]|uniref:Tc1-like transposase DDE domain-containing protein n=1 Tax=Thelohanellus kitauei TaxID=669202 RepID=A0A0C2MWM7_THEKT|nr:hypothetical protein RF11_13197 [Thelohanellus kitauei]
MPQIRSKNFSLSCCTTKSEVVYSETSERPYSREFYGVSPPNLFRVLQLWGTRNGAFIMENVGCHKCEEIKNLFSSYNHAVLYLPSYSPFLNPIEEAVSNVKVIVRRADPKNSDELIRSIN